MYRAHHYPAPLPFQKVLDWNKANNLLFTSDKNIEIAIANGKYEWLLKESVQSMEAKDENYKSMRPDWWQKLLAHATTKQIEEIIWPTFITYFQKEYNSSEIETYEVMVPIFNKLSVTSLEDLFPLFLQFCEKKQLPFICQKLLLILIERLLDSDVTAKTIPLVLLRLCKSQQINLSFLNCILQQALPECIKKLDPTHFDTQIVPKLLELHLSGEGWILTSHLLLLCFSKMPAQTELTRLKKDMESYLYIAKPTTDTEAKALINQRTALIAPYIALISRLDKKTNDSLSEKLLQFLPDNMNVALAGHIFSFIKSLRLNGTYVNESLFKKIENIVQVHNEQCLQTTDYMSLRTSHLSIDQLDRFLATEVFESKHDLTSPLHPASQKSVILASILTEAHPIQQKTKCLELILKNTDEHPTPLPDCIELTHIQDSEFRKSLIKLAQSALTNITKYTELEKKLERQDRSSGTISQSLTPSINKYSTLLNSCLAVMTIDEIIVNVLPTLKETLESGNKDLIKACVKPLKQVFSKLQDVNMLDVLFDITLALYKEQKVDLELLVILSKKVTPQKIAYARANVSLLLQNKYETSVENNYVSLLAILSNYMSANNLQPADDLRSKKSCTLM